MKEASFHCLDGTHDRYMIIDSGFLRENKFIVCPNENVIKIPDGEEIIWLFLTENGDLCRKHLHEVNLRTTENITLGKWEKKVVGVTWLGKDDRKGPMLYETGKNKALSRKGLEVLDGVLDESNARVCLLSRRNKNICIREGEVIGQVFSVQELDAMPEAEEWTYDSLYEQIVIDVQLNDVDRNQIVQMLYERRNAISLNEEDLWETRLPAFSIEISDNTPIYQRP